MPNNPNVALNVSGVKCLLLVLGLNNLAEWPCAKPATWAASKL
jgi:hypothetical protein